MRCVLPNHSPAPTPLAFVSRYSTKLLRSWARFMPVELPRYFAEVVFDVAFSPLILELGLRFASVLSLGAKKEIGKTQCLPDHRCCR